MLVPHCILCVFLDAHIGGVSLSFTNAQRGRHTGFNVTYNPNITTIATTTMAVLFKFIYEAITPQTTHTKSLSAFAFTLSYLTLLLSPPQENLSIPACNTLWLCCCLYLRKQFLCLTCLLHLITLMDLHHTCA